MGYVEVDNTTELFVIGNISSYKTEEKYFSRLRREINNRDKSYEYNIVHWYDQPERDLFVSINLSRFALMGLIASIEKATIDYTVSKNYSLSAEEVMEIIDKYYMDVTYLENGTHVLREIDMFHNYAYHVQFDYEKNMPELHRDGLLDYVVDLSIRNEWINN